MSRSKLLQAIEYQVHPTGIHEYVFMDASAYTITQFFNSLNKITRQVIPGEVLRCLLDTSQSGMLPVRQFIPQLKEWMMLNPRRPASRIAIVHDPETFVSPLLDTFINALGLSADDRFRFFTIDELGMAENWMLQND